MRARVPPLLGALLLLGAPRGSSAPRVVRERRGCERVRCEGVGCQDYPTMTGIECLTEPIVGCAEVEHEEVTCEYLSRCGPDMWYPQPCIEEEVERWQVVTLSPSPPAPDAAESTCQWRDDGVCDEPNFCNVGTDCLDCGNCVPTARLDAAVGNITWVLRPRDSARPWQCGSQTGDHPPIQARCRSTARGCQLCSRCADGLYLRDDRKACLLNTTRTEAANHVADTEQSLVLLAVMVVFGGVAFAIIQPCVWRLLRWIWKVLRVCHGRLKAIITGNPYVVPTDLKDSSAGSPKTPGAVRKKEGAKGELLQLPPLKKDATRLRLVDLQAAADAAAAAVSASGGSRTAAKAAAAKALRAIKKEKTDAAIARNERAIAKLTRASPHMARLQGPLPPISSPLSPSTPTPMRGMHLPGASRVSMSPRQFSPISPVGARGAGALSAMSTM